MSNLEKKEIFYIISFWLQYPNKTFPYPFIVYDLSQFLHNDQNLSSSYDCSSLFFFSLARDFKEDISQWT